MSTETRKELQGLIDAGQASVSTCVDWLQEGKITRADFDLLTFNPKAEDDGSDGSLEAYPHVEVDMVVRAGQTVCKSTTPGRVRIKNIRNHGTGFRTDPTLGQCLILIETVPEMIRKAVQSGAKLHSRSVLKAEFQGKGIETEKNLYFGDILVGSDNAKMRETAERLLAPYLAQGTEEQDETSND